MSLFNYIVSWISVCAFSLSFIFQNVALVSYGRAVHSRLKQEHSKLKSKSRFWWWVIRSVWESLTSSKNSQLNLHAIYDDLIVLTIIIIYWNICLLALLALYGRVSCAQNNKGAVGSYVFAKIILYQLLFERVNVIYDGTAFAYRPMLIQSLKVFSFVSTMSCLIVWVMSTKLASRKTFAMGLTQCRWFNPALIMAGIFFIELVNSFLCLYMFTEPLRKLLQYSNDVNGQNNPPRGSGGPIAATAKRQTILSYCMIASTLASVLLTALVRSYFSVAMDLIANVSCLLMMTNYYGRLYPRVCFIPIVLADLCCGCDESGVLFKESTIDDRKRTMALSLSLDNIPSNNPSVSRTPIRSPTGSGARSGVRSPTVTSTEKR